MADGGALCRSETQHGQAGQRLTLANGDTLWLALQGAHVVSWQAAGRERLYLSPRNVWDGRSAIRGGVPVCFPQFNQRGSLPKHGFARNSVWTAGQAKVQDEQVQLDLTLTWSAQTLALWQPRFDARLRVALAPGALALQDGAHRLEISQSPSWANSVVWNPGRDKCAAMADLPPDGYSHFLCVEAAQVMSPITVAAAAHWQGWQRFRVLQD